MTDTTSRLSTMAMEVAADPGSPHYPKLASALVEAGRYAEAVEVCERGLAVSPGIAAQRVLAEAQLLLPDLEGAQASAKLLLSEDPRDALALRVLGACLIEFGDALGAREVLERSASIDPSDMRTLDLLAGLPDVASKGEPDWIGEDGPAGETGWSGPSFSHELDMPTAEEQADSRGTNDHAELDDPFGEPASASDDPFAGPSLGSFDAQSMDDPFAAPSPAPEDDPFAAPSPAPVDDPFAAPSPAPLDDPFGPPATPAQARRPSSPDPLGGGESKPADDPFGFEDPFAAPSSSEPKPDPASLDPFSLPDPGSAEEPPFEDSDPFASPPPTSNAPASPPYSARTDPTTSGSIPGFAPSPPSSEQAPAASPAGEPEDDPFDLPGPYSMGPPAAPVAAASVVDRSTPMDGEAGATTRAPAGPSTAARAKTAVPAAPPKRPLAERSALAAKLVGAKYYVIGGGSTIVLAFLILALAAARSERDDEAFADAMAMAQAAMALDTSPGYREASLHLAEALEKKPTDPHALGRAAFAATLLHTRFDAGIEAAMAAEDFLAQAEPQHILAPEAAAARGLLNLQVQRPADAVSAVTRSLGDHPGHPALMWVRALAEVLLDREDMALESLRHARRSDPNFVPAATTLAELLNGAGYPEEAAAVRLEVIEDHPSHLTTLIALVEDARTGHADPKAVLSTILPNMEAWEDLPTELRCPLYLAAADISVIAGDPARATEAEDQARALQMEQACQTELGNRLIARHRPVEAYRALSSVATRGDFSVRREAAHAALSAGRPEWAVDMLTSGRDPIDKALLALALHRNGRAQEARTAAEAASSNREADALVSAVLALVALAEGDAQSARLSALRARSAGSDPIEALYAGIALLDVDEARQASRILDSAMQAVEYPHYELLVAAARAAAATGREAMALRRLEEAISLNPDPEPAVEMYLELASKERALRFFSRVPSPWSAPLLGLAHFRHRELDLAAQELESARAENPVFWWSYLNACLDSGTNSLRALITTDQTRMMPKLLLVDRLLTSGRVTDALEIVRDGLRRSPGHPHALARLAEAIALASTNPLEATDGVRGVLRGLAVHPVDRVTQGRVQGALALACAAAGDNRCSRQAAGQARRLAPRDGRTLLLIGRSLELTGDTRGARTAYIAASNEDGAEEALLRAGLLSRGAEASTALQRFLESAPNHALAPLAQQALANAE